MSAPLTRLALPRLIHVGAGASQRLGEVADGLGVAELLIVTDPYLVATGAVDRLTSELPGRIRRTVYSDTAPDPTVSSVDRLVRTMAGGRFDAIVGFGGGSPIDTAKAAAVLSRIGGPMAALKAPAVTDRAALPMIAIPTTAGSGSECTQFTIITEDATQEKMLCSGLAFLPVAALVDYTLTLSMPPRLTADTGVDALTHAIEAYVSRRANPFSDTLARSAMTLIAANVRGATADGQDTAARSAMMLGAMQAGIAFSNASVALVHGMSRPLGSHFRIAHGLSNAMLLPIVTAFSVQSEVGRARYADCARLIAGAGERDSDQLAAGLAVPTPREHGIDAQEWQRLIPTMAAQAIASGSPSNNPRVPTVAEIAELYQALWDQ
jgi:alcohol dehydrogenase class IV